MLISEAGITVQALQVESAGGGYNPEHLLDGKHAKENLVVRNWRAGERFWPAHTKEPKKVKELLQDRHITGDEKKRWPVVASGDEIVWVKGLGVRRDLQATNGCGVLDVGPSRVEWFATNKTRARERSQRHVDYRMRFSSWVSTNCDL